MRLSAVQRDALASYEFTERELTRYERDGFEVAVIAEMETVIPLEEYARDEPKFVKRLLNGHGEFFALCVYIYFEDIELGTASMGGCAYDDPNELIQNGTAEELASAAIAEAKALINRMRHLAA
jgi:hypothetical protein